MTIDELKDVDNLIDDYQILYDDIDLTYLLRNHVVTNLRNKEGKGHSEISLNKKAMFRLVFGLLQTLPQIFCKKDIWVFSNAERRKKINGQYVDRVTSIVSYVCQSVLFVETPIISSHKLQTKDKIVSESWLYFISLYFKRVKYKPSKVHIKGDLSALEEKLGIKINILPRISRYVAQYEAMKWLLKYRRPKCVFLAYPNGYSGYIKCFKENKIPVVELQHGIIYPLHYSYNCSLDRDICDFYPDYILTYGSRDKQTLEELSYLDSSRIVPIGSYALWLYKTRPSDFSNYLMNLMKLNQGPVKIAMSATVHDLEKLYRLGTELGKLNPQYKFFLMPRGKGAALASNRYVEMLDTEKCNIYELMKSCDYHITMSSTCGIEALYFDKPSIIYEDVEGESMFRKNYPFLKTLKYASTLDQVMTLLTSNLEKVDIENDIAQLFVSDTDKRFEKFLKELYD